ncbi:hypothetical protein QWY14_10905 [Planococcus sp. N028]|uniref:Uncharacterized protein n=1 Tax=Planococcus shixiaomingii TaxID=3058393 RepID=A0ABT8N349_9BACL|nr:hypothetical protein [Planococcus sp. N028]
MEFAEEKKIETMALLNNEDHEYAAVLGRNEVLQIYKDDNGELLSSTEALTGSEEVKFGTLNSVVYVMINDEELLEKGHTLKLVYKGGEFSSTIIRSGQGPYVALHDSSEVFIESVSDYTLYIYDAQNNIIYEDIAEV